MKNGIEKGEKLLIPNHVNQSINLSNQEQVLECAVAFISINILCQNAGPKSCFTAAQCFSVLHPEHVVLRH
jgi:hypothetical protein